MKHNSSRPKSKAQQKRFETVSEVMMTAKGKRMKAALSKSFDDVLSIDPVLKLFMDRRPTYLGSEAYFERLTLMILNMES